MLALNMREKTCSFLPAMQVPAQNAFKYNAIKTNEKCPSVKEERKAGSTRARVGVGRKHAQAKQTVAGGSSKRRYSGTRTHV